MEAAHDRRRARALLHEAASAFATRSFGFAVTARLYRHLTGDRAHDFAAFDRPDARFLDGARAWPSVEPAIDFTSTGMLAFALRARHLAAPQLRPERWR